MYDVTLWRVRENIVAVESKKYYYVFSACAIICALVDRCVNVRVCVCITSVIQHEKYMRRIILPVVWFIIIIIIIIIIISCYTLWDIGRQQNVAILSYCGLVGWTIFFHITL